MALTCDNHGDKRSKGAINTLRAADLRRQANMSETNHGREIVTSQAFDTIRKTDGNGESWSARDLQPVLGYDTWRRFEDSIDRAKVACANSEHDVSSHFAGSDKINDLGYQHKDYRLTRYACYLIAMNGDPRKPEIARAQTYFAVKTREAEVAAVPSMRLPQNFSEALRLAADEYDARVIAEAKVAELEPAANSWNTLATASGDLAVADAAKILSRDPNIRLGRDRLFTVLRDLGWCFRQRGDNRHRSYQKAIDAGWLMELTTSHYDMRTGELVLDVPQIRVTVKGLHRLHQQLGGTARLALDAAPSEHLF
jgi:DNA-damage-inducible protein D